MAASIPPPRQHAKGTPSVARPSTPPQPLLAARVRDSKPLSAQRRSYVACFAHFIHEARAFAPDEVIPYPGDAELALVNARAGTDAACADLTAIATHLPMLSIERALETPDVARAVIHATLQTDAPAAPTEPHAVVVQRVKTQRRNMVNTAQTLADKGKLPADQVARLGRTKGPAGLINDAVLVAGIFTEHANAIAGMHPFTQKDIDTLRADAEWLRENTRPSDARRPKLAKANGAVSDRDRLWTLLVRRHAMLRQIAGYFHPDDIASIVPPLRSRVRMTATADEEVVDRPPVTPPTP